MAAVSLCGRDEANEAIKCASDAFTSWSARTAKDRARILRRWHQAIVDAKDDITRIMTTECGKPLVESRNEFDSG